MHDASPATLAQLPRVRERIAAVRTYRRASKSKPTQKLAETPTLYHVNILPSAPFLVLPEVSSERREYVPVGWLKPPVIPSNKLRLLPDATITDFALLTSAMHMAWMRAVTGRMKSDYMYSVGVVYNTFPTPPGFKSENANMSALEPLAQAVLDARAAHQDATLAEIYDPDLMPPNLRRAHHAVGPRRRPSLPPCPLHLRARTRRVPLRFVRANAGPAGRKGCEQGQAPTPNTRGSPSRIDVTFHVNGEVGPSPLDL